jgi:hypothetical protein
MPQYNPTALYIGGDAKSFNLYAFPVGVNKNSAVPDPAPIA